jgi:hypothetical protein
MGAGADPDEFLEELEVFGARGGLTRSPNVMNSNGTMIVGCDMRLVMRILARPLGITLRTTPTSLRFRNSSLVALT